MDGRRPREPRRILDKIWRVDAPPWNGVWNAIRQRLLSFGMVLAIGFLMMVSLVASAAITAVGAHVIDGLPGSTLALRAIEFIASFAAITGLFAMIYKIIPSERLAWGDVWVGAAMTSLLFWVGKYLIGLYLGKSAIASPFGAAGTLVVAIVWILLVSLMKEPNRRYFMAILVAGAARDGPASRSTLSSQAVMNQLRRFQPEGSGASSPVKAAATTGALSLGAGLSFSSLLSMSKACTRYIGAATDEV